MDIKHTPFEPWIEGVFDIPNDLYHSHVKAPEISRSMIVELAQNTPAHVKAVMDGERIKKATKQMVSGTLADLAILEPDKFKEGVSHWIRPEGLDLRTKEGKQWEKDHPALPAILDSSDDPAVASMEDIQGMIASVMSHKVARRIVEQSVKQESVFCYDPDTGLLRKVRPDARLVDGCGRLTLGDLKTTFVGGTSSRVWASHAASMGYFVQDPFYSDVYKDLMGEEPFFLFFVVERKPPYAVRVFQIDSMGRQAGRELYKRSMEQFAKCKQDGLWPAHNDSDGIETIRLPYWVIKNKENNE